MFEATLKSIYYLCLNIVSGWMLWIKQLDHQREGNDKTIGPPENRILIQHVHARFQNLYINKAFKGPTLEPIKKKF